VRRIPTLLVIEDAHDQALLVGHAARKAHPGLDVRTVHDGLDGIAYLAGAPPFEDRSAHPHPNLVILDLMMPEVDGFEVLAYVQEHLSPAPCPVVVLTSSHTAEEEERALRLGATRFYRKSAQLDALSASVKEIVHEWIGRGEIIAAHIWAAG